MARGAGPRGGLDDVSDLRGGLEERVPVGIPVSEVCWVSLDPVRRKVDFYPQSIAMRLESAYAERELGSPTSCVLGSDFFNATVHFHPTGGCYQTTPGMSMGRAGYKQPGYRSVKRVLLEPPDVDRSGRLNVHGKQVHGEWRIADSEADAEAQFSEEVPAGAAVAACTSGSAQGAGAAAPLQCWSGADLDLSAGRAPVDLVVWQWCRGLPERHGNIMALGEEWWCPCVPARPPEPPRPFLCLRAAARRSDPPPPRHPSTSPPNLLLTRTASALSTPSHPWWPRYLEATNRAIEAAFSASVPDAVIQVPARGELKVEFARGGSFALQRDAARRTERAVRRVVKTAPEVSEMLRRLTEAPDHAAPAHRDDTPHHFFCPIFQDVMRDPVMTVDGFTYERLAIERWLAAHDTSPLTGLDLPSKLLTPNAALRAQIEDFQPGGAGEGQGAGAAKGRGAAAESRGAAAEGRGAAAEGRGAAEVGGGGVPTLPHRR